MKFPRASRIILGGVLTAVALVIATSVESQPAAVDTAQDKPNVVLVTIDTLRADHVGCYGKSTAETPNIDALAREGARFAHAYTPVPITLPAHGSLFTGTFPTTTGMHDFAGNKLPASAVTLGEVLRDNGYTTAAFVASAVVDSRFGLNQGFETYFDYFDFSQLQEAHFDQLERRGDRVMDEVLSWLRRNPRQPFFLWVHLYDPHHPYTPPEPYARRFRDAPYDGEVAFADAQVGRLLDRLRERKLFENAVIILASDHGEGLGDHGEKTHGFYVYNSTLHVPLILRLPGVSPRVVSEDVSLVDVMPTILQALKLPVPPGVQGRGLMSSILGRPAGTASNLYAETYLPLLHFHWSQLRALQSRGWKFIEAPKPELYEIQRDPGETNNLFARQRARAHEMRDRLYGLMRRYTPAAGPETEKALTDPALYDRLRSLGYVAVSAGTFAQASGGALPDPKDRIQVYELISDAMNDGQRGQQLESLRKLREAAKIEPQSPTIHYMMGLNYQRLRDAAKALEHFRAALQTNPNFSVALHSLGLVQMESGDLDGAAASLARALELDPTHFSASFNLGIVHLKKNRYEDAFREFQRTVAINPDFAPGHAAVGEGYLQQGKPGDAARELERAVQLDPRSRRARHSLSRAYQALGRTADAERELHRANSIQ